MTDEPKAGSAPVEKAGEGKLCEHKRLRRSCQICEEIIDARIRLYERRIIIEEKDATIAALRAENAELRARVESDLMQQNATAKTLRAELAQAKEEIAKLKRVEECPACRDGVPHSQTPLCHIGPATTCGDGSTRIPEAVLASEKAAKERAEALIATRDRMMDDMANKIVAEQTAKERAESRVKRLAGIMEARGIHEECGGVKSGTGVVLCNCARTKEGEQR